MSAIILNLVPVFGAGLAVVLLGSVLSVMQLFGAAVILASVFVVGRGIDDRSDDDGQSASDNDMRGAAPDRVCAPPAATNPTAS